MARCPQKTAPEEDSVFLNVAAGGAKSIQSTTTTKLYLNPVLVVEMYDEKGMLEKCLCIDM